MLRLGIVVSGDTLKGVLLDCSSEPAVLVEHFSWKLQTGKKPEAYRTIAAHVRDFVQEHQPDLVAIKASGAGQKMTLSHLHSAELRGVAIVAAVQAGVPVILPQKAVLSRTFGERKTDDYLQDDRFWDDRVDGDLRKTYREAAFMALSADDQ